MRRLKLLVIDEVSMVRSDMMWAIDQSLRLNRGRPREPFGGVRLVLFGDLHQLPPVVQEAEVAEHLELDLWRSVFFSLPTLREGSGTALLELTQVFRQRDEELLRVLNRIRDGEADEDSLGVLTLRVHPIRTLAQGDAYVILTPTNAAAQRINMAYLDALPGAAQAYQAGITGEFGANAHPTDTTLVLKQGAKVIMLRNDADRRWVNGTIARVLVWKKSASGSRSPARSTRSNRPHGRAAATPTTRRSRRSWRRSPARSSSSPTPRLGTDHPQVTRIDARSGLHRSGPRHFRARPSLRCAFPLPYP